MVLLETERLLFRAHQIEDLDAFCALEADPDFRRYVGGEPRARQAAEEKFRRVYLPAVRDRMGLWATVFKENGAYIGYSGVYPHFRAGGRPVEGEGSIAFYLSKAYWNRGLATEGGRAFIEFAFGELLLSRLVTAVEVGNDASAAVLRKLGFRIAYREHGEKRSFDHYELRNDAQHQ